MAVGRESHKGEMLVWHQSIPLTDCISTQIESARIWLKTPQEFTLLREVEASADLWRMQFTRKSNRGMTTQSPEFL